MNEVTEPPGKDAPIEEQRAYWQNLLEIPSTTIGADGLHALALGKLAKLADEPRR